MDFAATFVELIGTFLFLSVIFITGNPLAIGASLTVLIYLGIDVSGGHYNPAVTIAALYNKGISPDTAVGYILAQIVGGLAAVTLRARMN